MTANPNNLTVIATEHPVSVVVNADDGRWFKCLHWLVESGIWAGLGGEAASMLIVLHHLADRESRWVAATIEDLQRLSGLSRTGTYRAIQTLTSHPDRLLAADGAGWALLPGRVYAGRVVVSEPNQSHRRDGSVPNTGQKSHRRDGAWVGDQRHSAHTNQTKSLVREEQEPALFSEPEPGSSRDGLGVAGQTQATTVGAIADEAARRMDAGRALKAAGVREPVRGWLIAGGVTAAAVERTARELERDRTALDKVGTLIHRLRSEYGVMFPEPRVGRDVVEAMGGLAAIRQQRGAR